MDQDLVKLQNLVKNQIEKAATYKSKIENQLDQLNSPPYGKHFLADPKASFSEQRRPEAFPLDSKFESKGLFTEHRTDLKPLTERKTEIGKHIDAKTDPRRRVSFENKGAEGRVISDRRILSAHQLPALSVPESTNSRPNSSMANGKLIAGSVSANVLPIMKGDESPSGLKLVIPKTRRKSEQVGRVPSANILGQGKVKRVRVHSIVSPQENDCIGRVSPQLIEDIGEAFKGIYKSQKMTAAQLQQSHEERFESRIRTPRELLGEDDFAQSHFMMDSFVSEVNDAEKAFQDSKVLDAETSMSVRELTSIVQKEKNHFDSLSLYIETKYIEMKEHEKASGVKPTRLKTAICADLITKLCYGLERYTPIMEPLIWELFNSIFDNFAQREMVLNRNNFLTEIFKFKSYYELYHEAHDALEDISDELEVIQQGMRLKDIVKKFQTVRLAFNEQQGFIRDICYKAWKILWVRGKRLRKVARRRGLQYRWNNWRKFVKRRTERELEDYSHELDKKIQKLVELNNIIANQSSATENPDRTDNMRRSIISFGTASLIDASKLPTPINTSRISDKVQLAGEVSRRVSKNFESVTIATTPSMRRSMSMRIRTAPSIDEEGFNSFNLEPESELESKLMESVEKAVKLSADIANESRDVMTQTPDEWMSGINESNLLSDLSLSKSFAFIGNNDAISVGGLSADSADGLEASPGALRRSSVFRYQINIVTACQLIAYIYENRYNEILIDSGKADFKRSPPLLQFSKHLLLKRYNLRRLAQKFYRGLVTTCTRESVNHKRLELFGMLCGIPLADHADTSYDYERCTYFFRILSTLFKRRLDSLANSFATGEIDRALILTFIPEIFADLKDKDVEFYQNIIYDVVDLPATDPSLIEKVYKVDIDEVLSILMDVYEVKYKKTVDDKDPFVI